MLRITVLFALLLAGCASRAGSTTVSNGADGPRAGEPQAGEQTCWRDQECALVADCCGCANGGLQLSVRSDKLEAVTERGASECENRICNAQPSQHRSCKATAARFVGGTCLPAL
jgi:hypothetical protein